MPATDRPQSGARTPSRRSRPPPHPGSPPAAREGTAAPPSSPVVSVGSRRDSSGSRSGPELRALAIAFFWQSSKRLWNGFTPEPPAPETGSPGRTGHFPGGDSRESCSPSASGTAALGQRLEAYTLTLVHGESSGNSSRPLRMRTVWLDVDPIAQARRRRGILAPHTGEAPINVRARGSLQE